MSLDIFLGLPDGTVSECAGEDVTVTRCFCEYCGHVTYTKQKKWKCSKCRRRLTCRLCCMPVSGGEEW